MASSESPAMSAAGLFAGIGGLELGLVRSSIAADVLVESWSPAQAVLKARFPDCDLKGDVTAVDSLPTVDVLTAGFPCTDLSQAGLKSGINGAASGLVRHVFRLLPQAQPTWLVFENVRNMLALDGGRAMRFLVDELEAQGYRWAYRLIDSRSFGVPQRRQRVLMVASKTEDPTTVLFADEALEPGPEEFREDAFGFTWTEGMSGLGWAQDAVPTLKGGSTIGIPSPPAVWMAGADLGRRIVTPTIEDVEALQGFPRGWTNAAALPGKRGGPRWRLVGNAVTVDASAWLGRRLVTPGSMIDLNTRQMNPGDRWPTAAFGSAGTATAVMASLWPLRAPYRHLLDVVVAPSTRPLTLKATAGFLGRMDRSNLTFDPVFKVAVKEHVDFMRTEAGV